MEVRHGGRDYLPEGVLKDGGFDGAALIDFSVNVSPLGLPDGAAEAIRRAAADCHKYPDPFCRNLRSALSSLLAVDAGNIVCGNGAGELIYRIVMWKKPRAALICAPSFSDYEKALVEISCNIGYHELSKDDFSLDDKIMPKIDEAEIVFLCNPNNPTGKTINPILLRDIIRRASKRGITLVIDECFNEFLDEPGAHTALPYIDEARNLIILRAFTKIYAMAGLRLGYCVTGSAEDAAALSNTGQAWPVSIPAQAVGIAALSDKDYVKRVRSLVKTERTMMKDAVSKLGIKVLGGEANFIFLKIDADSGFDKNTFFDSLLRRNILIRGCDNYRSLDESYYRAAVLNRSENAAMIEALREIKMGGGGVVG
ncbi:MAG: aminotransferase class I/II-fold pyridoxal phosphate-dependent enzyme [Spirochaetaceae bacterium]|jgi:threonine-phosphate decarboxylase|nr:aminotransferase class I/II-fold pyridoxal phosphate-dependent enzyme [Spirochaetaceae bacterium]